MILSDKEIKKRIIKKGEVKQAKKLWKDGKKWSTLHNRILIEPFRNENVGPCCYDLSVGEEYVSLRNPYDVKQIGEGKFVTINPSETILVLTEEYICLPKNLMGVIVPRATWIFEGTMLNATKIDPTWYGNLLISFTNHTKNIIRLYRGESFCTAYFMGIPEVKKSLSKSRTPFLGRRKIGRIDYRHIQPQKLLSPEEVTQSHMKEVTEIFGYPYDIINGALRVTKDEIIKYIEKDVAPRMVQEAVSTTTEKAYSEQQKWFKILISGILVALFGFIGSILYIVFTVLP